MMMKMLITLVLLSSIAHGNDDNNPQHPTSKTHYEIESEKVALNFTPGQLEDLANLDAVEATILVLDKLTESVHDRLATIFEKATSAECRAKIATNFAYWIKAIGNEDAALPFVGSYFHNSCPEPHLDFDNLPEGVSFESIMHRTYQPPRDEAEYIEESKDLKILYGILMHGGPNSTIRLIETLHEEGHTFVVHVDAKPESDDAYDLLLRYALEKPHVHIIPQDYRVRANWGGYSMVNATIQIFKYSFALLHDSPIDTPLDFHKFVHLSASSYPIKSNSEIRDRIASYPLDANMVMTMMKPLNPDPYAFNYYVECDDAVHRIYRLPPLTEKTHGAELYTSSQWFIISREFAEYMARAERGTFVHDYMQYAQHAVVADETFFGTVLRNSEFCTKHHNKNYMHLQFDRWESDIESKERNERKCLSPDPNRCGRSPTLLTRDDFFALELSDDLFARKFSDDDTEILDIIDEFRAGNEMKVRDIAAGNYTDKVPTVDTRFEGHGTLITAKDTVDSSSPLCVGLGSTGYYIKLVPCFHDAVVPTLSQGWETGAVIQEEVLSNNQFEVGPCNSDGILRRRPDTAQMESSRGKHSSSHCLIKILGSRRAGYCIDIQGERLEPGGQMQVFPCMNKWHQMFGFGDEEVAPIGSIHSSIPKNVLNTILHKGKDQAAQLCFGASGRGGNKYDSWSEDDDSVNLDTDDFVPKKSELDPYFDKDEVPPLSLWQDKFLVTVPCADTSAVIEFVFVPFVVEGVYQENIDIDDTEAEESQINLEDEL